MQGAVGHQQLKKLPSLVFRDAWPQQYGHIVLRAKQRDAAASCGKGSHSGAETRGECACAAEVGADVL